MKVWVMNHVKLIEDKESIEWVVETKVTVSYQL